MISTWEMNHTVWILGKTTRAKRREQSKLTISRVYGRKLPLSYTEVSKVLTRERRDCDTICICHHLLASWHITCMGWPKFRQHTPHRNPAVLPEITHSLSVFQLLLCRNFDEDCTGARNWGVEERECLIVQNIR